jgi:hypothetical protein
MWGRVVGGENEFLVSWEQLGPGLDPVRLQGSVHLASGPGPSTGGPFSHALAWTLGPPSAVQSGPRATRARTDPRTV